jgi:hypothetical protein
MLCRNEPNSTEVFKLYPGDMLKVNYDIWIRNSSHGDDYVVTHSFGATESVGADESGVTTSSVNPFFSSAAQHSNSFNLNFNHANKKSHKITCSSNGRGFTVIISVGGIAYPYIIVDLQHVTRV